MNRARALLVILCAASLVNAGCGSFSRKVNQALPEFLRSDPGEEEVQRYQQRVRILNRSEAETAALEKAYADVTVLFEEERWDEAAEGYEEFIENFPDSAHDEEARFRLILSHRNDEEEFETAQAMKRFLRRYPISSYNKEMEELLFTLATEYVDGEHDGFIFGSRGEGVTLFQEQVTAFPNGRYAADAYWRLGNHYYDQGEYFEAAGAYDVLVEKYAESAWASRALYNRALTRMTQIKGIEYDQRVMEQAVADFKTYLRDYPEADRLDDARVYIKRIENMICEKQLAIADWYEGQGFPGSARFVLTRAAEKWGHTEAAKEIPERLAALPEDVGVEVDLLPSSGAGKGPEIPRAGIPDSPPRPEDFPIEPAESQVEPGSPR